MDKIPMTAAGYAMLETELKHRQQVERPRIIQQITDARAHGDLSENAEYHAAKEQQSLNEGRIAELEDKLARADVIDVSKLSGDTIKFGATVTLVDEDTDKKQVWQIVGEPEADAKAGRISITSPLARALIGKTKGASVEVVTPGGAKAYEVKKVEWRFHRHHGRVLGIAQRQRGLHVAHVRRRGELLDEGLEGLEVGRHAFEHEVDLAREHPAFAHQRLRAHEFFERHQIGFRLARKMHHGEHGHLVAELLLVEQRAVALDVARLLQRAHAAQAGRRRNADPARQLHIGHAAVVLQFFQDLAVDGIETGGQAELPKRGTGTSIPRNIVSRKNIARSGATR